MSVKTVSNWECDILVPSNWHVSRMVELTGNSYLAYLHLKQTSEVLDVLPDTEAVPFSMAAIRLINKTLSFADRHRDRALLAIAEDGRIDETERPLFDSIMLELRELISAVYALRYAGEDKKEHLTGANSQALSWVMVRKHHGSTSIIPRAESKHKRENTMELNFNVEAASAWGVDEAVFVNNLAYWIIKNAANRKNIKDGVVWTYNSREALARMYPFWTPRQIERITRSCVNQGLIQTAQHGKGLDRTTWYCLTQKALDVLDLAISPNGEMHFAKPGNAFHETVQSNSPNGEMLYIGQEQSQDENTRENKAASAADVHAQAKEIFAEAVAGDPALMPMVEEFLEFRRKVKPYKTVRGPQMAANKLRGLSGDDHAVMARMLQRTLEREWYTFFALPEDEYPAAAAPTRTETGGIRFL